MELYEELNKLSEEYAKRLQTGFQDIRDMEVKYLKKVENIILDVYKENQELKAQLNRLQEDKAENEVMYKKVIKEYQAKLENRKGGK